jgi:dTDP-glucose 4,6-dehydratase
LITHVRDRPGHDRRYAINFAKASAEIEYSPGRSLHQGLDSTFDWYLANPSWWRPLLGRDYAAWMDANYAPKVEA